MKAIKWTQLLKSELVDIPKPEIAAPDDVLVKIEVTSICGTDVRILSDTVVRQGKLGMTLGHEAVGVIEELGSGVSKEFQVGDRVILDPFIACGECYFCKHGQPHICANLMVRGCRGDDGFFSEYVVAKSKNLIRVKKETPPELAVFGEPLYCVLGAFKKLNFQPGESVAILGAGPIGLYFTQIFHAYGASQIIVSEQSPIRMEYAKKSGATCVAAPEKVEEEILRRTGGVGVDACVDAVGFLLPEAVNYTRPGGKIVAFGKRPGAVQTVCEADIVNKGLTIYGNTQGDFTFRSAADLIESGRLDLEMLITHKFPIEEFDRGIDVMRRGEGMEVLIYP